MKKFNIKEWKDTYVNEGNGQCNCGPTTEGPGGCDCEKDDEEKDVNIYEGPLAQEGSLNEGPSVNDQAIKEFGDLLKLLLNQSNGIAIEKAIGDLDPVPAKSLRNQIIFIHKKLAKLTK